MSPDDQTSVDKSEFGNWASREHELRSIVGPILDSQAFNRLKYVTFLGILSPRFIDRAKTPMYGRSSQKAIATRSQDGSRRSHSLGVALLARDVCIKLRYSEEVQLYAVAWGLLHDLGNWPLSHTGEYAFAKVTGVSAKQLRNWLIVDDKRAPSKYYISHVLRSCNIDPERLISLFTGTPDSTLKPIFDLFQSPLTPDMLEGMWRCGRVFGVSVPGPEEFEDAFWLNLLEQPYLQHSHAAAALRFWRSKAVIYDRFFNSQSVSMWESRWSYAISELYPNVSLNDSLDISENEIVDAVLARGLPVVEELHRWKAPRRYRLRRFSLKNTELSMLSKTMVEEQAHDGEQRDTKTPTHTAKR